LGRSKSDSATSSRAPFTRHTIKLVDTRTHARQHASAVPARNQPQAANHNTQTHGGHTRPRSARALDTPSSGFNKREDISAQRALPRADQSSETDVETGLPPQPSAARCACVVVATASETQKNKKQQQHPKQTEAKMGSTLDDNQFRMWRAQLVPVLYDWIANQHLTWPTQAVR